nr:helix-turn-helix domain-containing protein [Sphaerisporangium cinnabarinum]
MSRPTPITVDEARQRLALNPEEAAHLLSVSASTVRRAAATGDLPSYRVGARILIPTTPLLELLGAAPVQEAS